MSTHDGQQGCHRRFVVPMGVGDFDVTGADSAHCQGAIEGRPFATVVHFEPHVEGEVGQTRFVRCVNEAERGAGGDSERATHPTGEHGILGAVAGKGLRDRAARSHRLAEFRGPHVLPDPAFDRLGLIESCRGRRQHGNRCRCVSLRLVRIPVDVKARAEAFFQIVIVRLRVFGGVGVSGSYGEVICLCRGIKILDGLPTIAGENRLRLR